MLFYFNIIEGQDEIPDPEGTDLANEAAAQIEARQIAAELLHEFPDRFGRGSVVEVFTDMGRRIMALPIAGVPAFKASYRG